MSDLLPWPPPPESRSAEEQVPLLRAHIAGMAEELAAAKRAAFDWKTQAIRNDDERLRALELNSTTAAALVRVEADRDALAAECAALGARNLATSYDRDAQANELRAEIARLTQALAEARREVEEQARLRRVAEDAIPRGIEVAKEFIRSEYERRLSMAEGVVEAARGLVDPAERSSSNMIRNCVEDKGGHPACSTCRAAHAETLDAICALRARLAEWEGK